MDLSDPTRAISSTLDGTVLSVLAASGKPLTVGQVATQTARGSEIGVRRSLARLVEQGIVRATLMGRNHVHELNRDHVAAPVAELLAGLRSELWRRFRDELQTWSPSPIYASVFGSAARGEGDVASDIDLLLVHQPFPGEKRPTRRNLGLQMSDAVARALLSSTEKDAPLLWEEQLDRLRELVEQWTGNPLQIVDLSFHEWRHPPESHRALFKDVQRDGIELVKVRGLTIWPSTESSDA